MENEWIASFAVDNWTDNQCRYCHERVSNGDRLYRADDGDICFECCDKSYGPFCRCGNPVNESDVRCSKCEEVKGSI